ncbi:Lar family restriction alleviation protein [Providencia rettgeri]|uniref:Lar family restriction alleviation protein n=2 Tax=Providencia TaxID=586 RepID=UPI001CFE3914|nr:Lar family restriction alleviation protein [Providencia rettgeri]MCB4843251.1 Lar family restriction alleviation protein [Providencia rettgeri]
MNELKKCPFCSKGNIVINEPDYEFTIMFRITCDDCGAGIKRLDKSTAIEAWNRRANSDNSKNK